MSKEQEPVRSRRELREADLEQKQGAAGYPPVPFVAAPSTPAVDRRARRTQPDAGPTDAGPTNAEGQPAMPAAPSAGANGAGTPGPRERQSQTRARDRAALRAYKELVDGTVPSAPLPSRRALRQAQLDAERAPITSINPVVQPAKAAPAGNAVPPLPQAAPASSAARASAASSAQPARATPAGPASTREPAPGRSVQRQPAAPAQADTSVQSPAVQPAPPHPTPAKPAAASAAPAEPRPRVGRRAAAGAADALPHGATATRHATAAAPSAGAGEPATGPLPGMPYPSVSVGPGISAGQPPSTEELRMMAEQRAQSERAAVLDQRAQARERLAQESAKSRRTAADPTATNNLAMVTPMEFVDVPGVDRPVLRPPSTTHVPIVTRSTPKLAPARRPGSGKPSSGKPAAAGPATPRDPNAERFDAALAARAVHRPGPGSRPLTGGRSSTLQRAEAMVAVVRPDVPARPGSVTRTQMPPMPADYAHGLEPLDAVTAGLGRTKRNLLIQWGSIILGGAALVVGAVMFITALAH